MGIVFQGIPRLFVIGDVGRTYQFKTWSKPFSSRKRGHFCFICDFRRFSVTLMTTYADRASKNKGFEIFPSRHMHNLQQKHTLKRQRARWSRHN